MSSVLWIAFGLVTAMAVGRFGSETQTWLITSLVAGVAFFSLFLSYRIKYKARSLPTQAQVDATTYIAPDAVAQVKDVADTCSDSLEVWSGLGCLVVVIIPAFHFLALGPNLFSESAADVLFFVAIGGSVAAFFALIAETKFANQRMDSLRDGIASSASLLDDLTSPP